MKDKPALLLCPRQPRVLEKKLRLCIPERRVDTLRDQHDLYLCPQRSRKLVFGLAHGFAAAGGRAKGISKQPGCATATSWGVESDIGLTAGRFSHRDRPIFRQSRASRLEPTRRQQPGHQPSSQTPSSRHRAHCECSWPGASVATSAYARASHAFDRFSRRRRSRPRSRRRMLEAHPPTLPCGASVASHSIAG